MIKRILVLVSLSLASFVAQAQALSPAQLATVCTACKADNACNTPRIAGDSFTVLVWLNAAREPATLAWNSATPAATSRQAPSYTTYDSLVAGKRDSWVLFLQDSQDFSKGAARNWVVDIWGSAIAASNSEKILQAATFNASNVQNALGGTTRTTGTVSALGLNYTGQAGPVDASWLVQPTNCQ